MTARSAQASGVESPYLTTLEAVAYLRLPSRSSLYTKIREHRLPVLRAGGELRFDKRELDAWLRGTTSIELARGGKTSTKSHGPQRISPFTTTRSPELGQE